MLYCEETSWIEEKAKPDSLNKNTLSLCKRKHHMMIKSSHCLEETAQVSATVFVESAVRCWPGRPVLQDRQAGEGNINKVIVTHGSAPAGSEGVTTTTYWSSFILSLQGTAGRTWRGGQGRRRVTTAFTSTGTYMQVSPGLSAAASTPRPHTPSARRTHRRHAHTYTHTHRCPRRHTHTHTHARPRLAPLRPLCFRII